MKKLLIFLLITLTVAAPAYAQTRQEFAVDLAEMFQLEGDFRGIFHYADWLQINKQHRNAVSACIQTGVFAPNDELFRPSAQVTSEDALQAANGLDKLILPSVKYLKVLGVVTAKNSNNLTIRTDDGIMISCPLNIPFMGVGGIGSCNKLSVGQAVALCVNESNEIILVWSQKNNDYELVGVRRGTLYLYDDPRFTFITTEPTQFRFGEWKSTGKKYDDLVALNNARIISRQWEVPREEINENWLDKKINYIIGKNPLDDGKLKILYVEFEQ